MATPLLNEEVIATMLAEPPTAETGQNLRNAAFFAAMDAYDRKVDRDSFMRIIKASLQLSEMMGRLESVTGVYTTLKNNNLTIERLEEVLAIITGHAEINRHSLVNDMSLLIQCPWDTDIKN